jgi:thioredoxin-like negative regulator of GroEL
VLAVVIVVVVIARRPIAPVTRWPSGVLSGPAIVFFSSRTCASCTEVRELLDEVAADRYREIGWEDDPDGWTAFGVESVPTVVLVDRNGTITDDMVGPADPRRLTRWLRKL